MTRTHLLYGFLVVVGGGCLILFMWPHGENAPDKDKAITVQHSGGIQTDIVDSPIVSNAPAQAKQGYERLNNGGLIGERSFPPPPEIPTEKLERIETAYNNLPSDEAEERVLEILTEGMDTLSAAKYLETLDGHYGDYRGVVREYAARAVAENPGDFDALLFKTQRVEDNTEREAEYRYLLEMDPDSVEVLYGLGEVLKSSQPGEAIIHLQKAVAFSPEYPDAYAQLSKSYRATGQLTQALAAAEKAYQIMPNWLTEAEIRVTKWLIEKQRNQPPDVQAEDTKTSMDPVLDGSSPSPEKTEAPVDKTTADESPTISPPAARDDNRRAEARQAMEAEFEKLLAEYERMIRGESAPANVVNQQISDLKRSIKSSPNRSDSYLELGRAYEKAGDDKKADEVYRQARKRFPKDKRFQRTLKAGSRTKRGSESNRKRRERPPQRSDEDKDPPSEDKR